MTLPNFSIESQYQRQVVAGVDEAGRGSLAGPVVAGCVVLDRECQIRGINDSKKLSKDTREELYEEITNLYPWSVGIVDADIIDKINVLEATKMACEIAVEKLCINPEIILIDGNMKFKDPRFISVIKGDNLSLSIAAASIIAKVTRDRLMEKIGQDYPDYLWSKNAGYGTKAHKDAISLVGLSKHHRTTFKFQ